MDPIPLIEAAVASIKWVIKYVQEAAKVHGFVKRLLQKMWRLEKSLNYVKATFKKGTSLKSSPPKFLKFTLRDCSSQLNRLKGTVSHLPSKRPENKWGEIMLKRAWDDKQESIDNNLGSIEDLKTTLDDGVRTWNSNLILDMQKKMDQDRKAQKEQGKKQDRKMDEMLKMQKKMLIEMQQAGKGIKKVQRQNTLERAKDEKRAKKNEQKKNMNGDKKFDANKSKNDDKKKNFFPFKNNNNNKNNNANGGFKKDDKKDFGKKDAKQGDQNNNNNQKPWKPKFNNQNNNNNNKDGKKDFKAGNAPKK